MRKRGPKMERNSWLLIFTIVIISLTFLGCSNNDDSDNGDGPTEEQLQQLDDIRQIQLEYYIELESILAEMDTAAAKDSIVAIMSSDTLIEWAIVTSQGINIQWEAGFGGTLLLDPKRSYSGDLEREIDGKRSLQKSHTATASVSPKSKKTLYIAAFYTEFAYYEDQVIDSANAFFANAGYDNFEVYKDAECSFSWFNSIGLLDDYGIIRIASHGNIWPSEADIQNVYLWTGEIVNRATDLTIFDYLASGLIHTGTLDSSTYYTIDGAFFAAANDFTYEKSFISLGFCYSALGNWPTDLVNFSGASAVTAYSWAVWDSADAVWTEDFFRRMCDTTRATPLTIGEWDSDSDRLYYNTEDSHWVALLYNGNDNMTLWIPLRILSINPTSGMEDTIITIEGVGFGNTEAQVQFGDIVASNIFEWSDTLIRVAVPAGLAEGIVIVKVVVDDRQSNGVEFIIGSEIDLSGFNSIEIHIMRLIATWESSYGPPADVDFDTDFGPLRGSFSDNTFYGYRDTTYPDLDQEISEVTVTIDPITYAVTNFEYTETTTHSNGYSSVWYRAVSGSSTNLQMSTHNPDFVSFGLSYSVDVCNQISTCVDRLDYPADSWWREITAFYCNEESSILINFRLYD